MATILGIESTAHTFGIGIVRDGKVISNVRDLMSTESGGLIPIEVAKHHARVSEEIYSRALKDAKIKENEIDAIAFSQGPGLAPCLLEGMKFAKALSRKLKKPLVPVNHCIAHLELGRLVGARDPVMLYTSGANTQVIAYASGKYRIFGETLDKGVGNFIDTFARSLGLGFPGGPKIQQLAEKGKNYVELPYIVKGMDISLSGILTNLKQKIEKMNSKSSSIKISAASPTATPYEFPARPTRENNKKKNPKIQIEKEMINYTKEDLAFSMQETVFAMLVEVAERALSYTGKKELLLAGGVACNSRLQEMARKMCSERLEKTKLFVPSRDLLVDNGAMIAYAGEIIFNSAFPPARPASLRLGNNDKKSGEAESKLIYLPKDLDKLDIKPRQRTDDVEVRWK